MLFLVDIDNDDIISLINKKYEHPNFSHLKNAAFLIEIELKNIGLPSAKVTKFIKGV